MNAREAMHLTELRSAREGHASYRAVAQAMHDAIADVHPTIAATFRRRKTTAGKGFGAAWTRRVNSSHVTDAILRIGSARVFC